MAKRHRGNPVWGSSVKHVEPVVWKPPLFEERLAEWGLSLEDAMRSTRVREWLIRNARSRYVPEKLLEAHGITVDFS